MIIGAAGPADRRSGGRRMERLEQDETVFGRCSSVPHPRQHRTLRFSRRVRIASSKEGTGFLSTISQRTPHRFPEKTQGIQ
ncbi:hypothetical protein [Azospirillum palustre]